MGRLSLSLSLCVYPLLPTQHSPLSAPRFPTSSSFLSESQSAGIYLHHLTFNSHVVIVHPHHAAYKGGGGDDDGSRRRMDRFDDDGKFVEREMDGRMRGEDKESVSIE